MTALMTLFLVVMAVTLIAVTKTVSVEEQKKKIEEERKNQREKDIQAIMSSIIRNSIGKAEVNASTYRINFGEAVRFESSKSEIKPGAARFLRDFIPILLDAQSSFEGKKWMRRVVVEGFTDQDGPYLLNLTLSLDRSKSVVCSLFAQPKGVDEKPLTDPQLRQIQELFLVGGYSFNSIQKDKAASRRVELKIEFWGLDETRPAIDEALMTAIKMKEFGKC
jgi:outer membrane protein OmpA-like peptidoglycan-associated protein